ncbi:hypothetical protein AC249_AIPGENE1450 [Exaiptasia diaphana]|nr:hypothetical protein AC249_AIPGENE1450 [Exaiptasia diaphana]
MIRKFAFVLLLFYFVGSFSEGYRHNGVMAGDPSYREDGKRMVYPNQRLHQAKRGEDRVAVGKAAQNHPEAGFSYYTEQ